MRAPSKHIVLQRAYSAVARARIASDLSSSHASKSHPPNSFKTPLVVAGKTKLELLSSPVELSELHERVREELCLLVCFTIIETSKEK